MLIFRGILNATPLHPREIFRHAIRLGTASLIVVHTHPSGDATPSAEDLEETKRVVEVGNLVGIPLDDYVIIGNDTTHHVSIRGLNPELFN